MAYRYQKELDLLEATRGELNITDTQYNELTDAIKAQGGSAEGGDEGNIQIPGYESVAKFWLNSTGGICFSIAAKEPGYHTFEAGLPVVIDLGKDINGNDYAYHSPFSYCTTDDIVNGPSCVADAYAVNTETIACQVPSTMGQPYGQYLNMTDIHAQSSSTHMTEADLELFKKNLKIKIG